MVSILLNWCDWNEIKHDNLQQKCMWVHIFAWHTSLIMHNGAGHASDLRTATISISSHQQPVCHLSGGNPLNQMPMGQEVVQSLL